MVHRRKAARPPQHHLQQLCCRYKVRTIVRVFFCCPGSCSRRRSSSGKFHTAAWPRLLQPGLIPNNCSESLLPGPGSPGCWYFFAGLPGEFRQPEVRRPNNCAVSPKSRCPEILLLPGGRLFSLAARAAGGPKSEQLFCAARFSEDFTPIQPFLSERFRTPLAGEPKLPRTIY